MEEIFSLFELERIDIEELKNQFPRQIGETDNITRANIALELAKEQKLKDCPLLSEYEYNRETFERILRFSQNEDVTDDLWESHRILCVYIIYSKDLLIPKWYDVKLPTLFEYPIDYDDSYFEEIRALTDNDLDKFIGMFQKRKYDWRYTHLMKEFAIRKYDEIKEDRIPILSNTEYDLDEYFLPAHLYILADKKMILICITELIQLFII